MNHGLMLVLELGGDAGGGGWRCRGGGGGGEMQGGGEGDAGGWRGRCRGWGVRVRLHMHKVMFLRSSSLPPPQVI